MKLGLITDIHEHVDYLERTLARFAEESVDQVVVCGDVFETGRNIDESCRLLADAGTMGVWGNHDYGLSSDPDATVRQKYSATVLDFMTSLRPRLIIDDCHFCHVEPWLDPENLADLWYVDGPPQTPKQMQRIFASVPQRVLFCGHFHGWLAATPDGFDDWAGERPIRLAPEERHFVVVGALCEGRFTIYDTRTFELIPVNLNDLS